MDKAPMRTPMDLIYMFPEAVLIHSKVAEPGSVQMMDLIFLIVIIPLF
jgi:hypothetical protein